MRTLLFDDEIVALNEKREKEKDKLRIAHVCGFYQCFTEDPETKVRKYLVMNVSEERMELVLQDLMQEEGIKKKKLFGR